jgi:hypothetical protein
MFRALRLALFCLPTVLGGCLFVAPDSVTPDPQGPFGSTPVTVPIASEPSSPPSSALAPTTALKVLVSPGKPVMEPEESLRLIAEVQLADGQINGNVQWSSSDDTIATVNPTTGKVTALREGRVTVVAAYALDPKVKGLAVLTIVADKAATPPPPPDDELAAAPPAPRPPVLPVQPGIASPVPVPTPAAGAANRFEGPDGLPGVIGPLLLTSGIHTFAIDHEASFGPLQVSIYTADGAQGENLYSGAGPLSVSFPYMVFQTGWYYLAVERAAGPWSITVD